MSAPGPVLELLGGRLRCRTVRELSEVSLSAVESTGAALLLVVDREVVDSDPITHYIFYRVMGEKRGHLLLVDPRDDDEVVSALPSAAEAARLWLERGQAVEVVAVRPVSLAMVAMAVLVATGLPAPKAVHVAFSALNDAPSAHDEVGCQVFLERLLAYRAWHEARRFQLRTALQ